MPYLIFEKRPAEEPGEDRVLDLVLSRCAVATLEDAREYVSATLDQHGSGGQAWTWHIASGGSVGPLADGVTVEVDKVEWRDIAMNVGSAGWAGENTLAEHYAALIAAYNAKAATHA